MSNKRGAVAKVAGNGLLSKDSSAKLNAENAILVNLKL